MCHIVVYFYSYFDLLLNKISADSFNHCPSVCFENPLVVFSCFILFCDANVSMSLQECVSMKSIMRLISRTQTSVQISNSFRMPTSHWTSPYISSVTYPSVRVYVHSPCSMTATSAGHLPSTSLTGTFWGWPRDGQYLGEGRFYFQLSTFIYI